MRRFESSPAAHGPLGPRLPSSTAGPRDGAGFSLIEVLAASALLAGVLIAIMGMFIYGGQSVNAGKMMTKATSISDDVLEQFRSMNFKPAYLLLSDTGNAAVDKRYVWNSNTNAPNYPTDPSYQAILNDWKAQVVAGLPQGQMTITVRGLQDLGANPPEETFANARIMQIVVTVRWKERKRSRSAVFETLKI